jgi:penicillin amidase
MLALAALLFVAPLQATVVRDDFGIPHVRASDVRSAFKAAGFAVAEDRMKQMDLSRRSARGKLAEVLGARGVPSDKDALRFGYTDAEYRALLEAMPKLTKEAVAAYSEGVNDYIRRSGAVVAVWEPTDSIAIGVNLVRRFGRGGAGEIRNLLLHTYLTDRFGAEAKKAFDDLIWQNDPASPTTANGSGGRSPFLPADAGAWDRHIKLLPKVNMFELLPAIRIEEQREMIDLAAELGVPHKWGSYAIVVDGKRGTHPMLLNGPQMGFSLPSVVHQMSIEAPGYKAVGMDIPGFPGIVIGRTDKSAWGATSGVADTDDIFFVHLDPENPTRYRHNGEWKTFEVDEFSISVKDGEPQRTSREMSVYGPVVLKSVGTGVAYVRKSSLWMNETKALSGILEHVAKGDIDFGKLAAEIPASFNLFGLGKGISWHYCGDVPIRSGMIDPRLPVPGSGEFDWKGLVPKNQMPKEVNPSSGLIANWNNKPVAWWPNFDTPIWGAIFRNASINSRLKEKAKVTSSDIEGVIREIAMEDSDAVALIPTMRRFPVSGLVGTEAFIYRAVMDWDGMRVEGSAPAVIYPAFFDALRRELFEPKLGGMLNPAVFYLATQASLTDKALRGETAVDYLAGRTAASVIEGATKRAAELLTRNLGEDTSKWVYEDGGIGWQGLARVPHSNRGTYIQLVEKHDNDLVGRFIAPPGVSENGNSPHFSDQVLKALNWTLIPMEFRSVAGNPN